MKKPFVHILVSFVCELFVGEQSCCVENRKVIMFASYNKTALCRLAFVSDFDFAQISIDYKVSLSKKLPLRQALKSIAFRWTRRTLTHLSISDSHLLSGIGGAST